MGKDKVEVAGTELSSIGLYQVDPSPFNHFRSLLYLFDGLVLEHTCAMVVEVVVYLRLSPQLGELGTGPSKFIPLRVENNFLKCLS